MTNGAPTVAVAGMAWWGIIAVLFGLASALSCAGERHDVAEGWKTYEHNRDRAPSAGCTERPNFAFDVPSNWQVKESTCDFVGLVAANEPAELQVVVLEFADYPEDVEAALDQMASRWLQEMTATGGSVERVQHRGFAAISRTHVEPALQQDACESYVDVLGVPSKSWATHGQSAVVLAVARCTDAHDQAAIATAIMDSFRLVEPY